MMKRTPGFSQKLEERFASEEHWFDLLHRQWLCQISSISGWRVRSIL
jgi:hypothetical protein